MSLAKKKRWILTALLLVFVFVLVSSVAAVDNFQEFNQEMNKQQQPEIKSTNLWLSFLQLVLVLGVIVAAAWSVIRLFGKRVNTKMQGSWMHVVDEVVLGQNRGIMLCEVGGKIYALGITDNEITLLFEVDNPKLLEEISQGNYELGSQRPETWPRWLTGFLQRFQFNKKPASSLNFQNLMKEQSQKIKEISSYNNHGKESATKRSGDNE